MAVALAPSRGLARTVQTSFAGGMYRNGSPDLIPADGFYDGPNCLLDLLGGIFKRGGSSYRSSVGLGTAGLRWVWDGTLAKGGQQTLVASPSEYARQNGPGQGFTSLGHGGVSAPPKVATYNGVLYFPGGATFDGETWGVAAKVAPHYAIVANRLVAAEGDHVWFSNIGAPGTFGPNDFHVIPGGVTIRGIEAGRDSCIVFTSIGVWVISNMAMNLVDSTGNVQQRLDRYSTDLILWGAAGIAGWEGNLIVPGTDAVWLINRGVTSEVIKSFARLSDQIRDLYREYVKAGYTPGRSVVHENHFLLPILAPSRVVDLLVCRLDLPGAKGASVGAWTHFTGSGGAMSALALRVVTGASPELLGAEYSEYSRVWTLNYFNPFASVGLSLPAAIPLDTFKRANEKPLSNGGKWSLIANTGGLTGGFPNAGEITGEAWHSQNVAGGSGAYWNVSEQTNPMATVDVSKYVTTGLTSGGWVGLGVCLSEAGNTGYYVQYVEETPLHGEYQVGIIYLNKGVETTLGVVSKVRLEAGDRIALGCREGKVTAWVKREDETALVLSVAHSALTKGYAGVITSKNQGALQNFAVTEAPAPGMIDADYTVPEFRLETRNYPTGNVDSNLVARLRARYIMWAEQSSPQLSAAVALEARPNPGAAVWGAFSWGAAAWADPGVSGYEMLAGTAPPSVDAEIAHSWRLHRRCRYVRFRLSCTQPAAQLTLKSLEVFVRPGGRV